MDTLTLRESIPRCGYFMLGMAVFPAFAVVAFDVYQGSQGLILFLFFVTCMPALVPNLFLRAPYGYWRVAGAVFMASGGVGGLLAKALQP